MSDLVRVRDDEQGVEYSIGADFARDAGLKILDGKPAVDEGGRALPAKPVVNTKTAATAKKES